jgi:hypothetical protein
MPEQKACECSGPPLKRDEPAWVKVEILAQGDRVTSAFNGVQVPEWRERTPHEPKKADRGSRVNGPQEVLYKDVVIETFPREDRLITVR